MSRTFDVVFALYPRITQLDFTGPFEVLARLPNATTRIFAKTPAPVRDVRGLILTPDATFAEAPQLDVLHVPGGFGQEALMDDEETHAWLRRQAAGARCVFSVCTGALICGAANALRGSPRSEKLFRALDATYLRPAATQELAAEHLGLPFNTYRYQLNAAIDRVTNALWEQELGA